MAESGAVPDTVQMIDSTIVRAHHHAAGAKKGIDVTALAARVSGARGPHRTCAMGALRGGFSTKVHVRANAAGLPIGFVITPGEAHDVTAYGALMDEAAPEPKVLLADRGYDADAIRPTSRNGAARP